MTTQGTGTGSFWCWTLVPIHRRLAPARGPLWVVWVCWIVASVVGSAPALAAAADDEFVPPIFEAQYEGPFGVVSTSGWGVRSAGLVLFRIWKKGQSGGVVWAGHRPAKTRDCGSASVHFCIEGPYVNFAVPHRDAPLGWSFRMGDDELRLVSRHKVYFRNSLIDVVTIRNAEGRSKLSTSYFVYNYDIGLISFVVVEPEDVRPAGDGVPHVVRQVMMLGGDHGLGGRENCKYWSCGKGAGRK